MDKDVAKITKFMKELPSFEGKFQLDSKQQQKNCFEKMKIKIFCRAQTVFKQGDMPKYAYVVLLGVVNFYDEKIKFDPHKFNKNDYQMLEKIDDEFKTIDGGDSFQERDQAYFEALNY